MPYHSEAESTLNVEIDAWLRKKMLATFSAVEVCLSSISSFFLLAGVYFYQERIKVFTLLLERKELICRLATPPTPSEAGVREEDGREGL